MLLPEIPDRPFAKVSMDVLKYATENFLSIMDYFSKWIKVIPMQSKTAYAIIDSCKEDICHTWKPQEVVADNMPFSSMEFSEFANNWTFKLITSSPHYPQSNGQAEKGVGIAKTLLQKSSDLNLALLEYRNTPITGLIKSPAQIAFNRA